VYFNSLHFYAIDTSLLKQRLIGLSSEITLEQQQKLSFQRRRAKTKEQLAALAKGATVSIGLLLASAVFYRTFSEPSDEEGNRRCFIFAGLGILTSLNPFRRVENPEQLIIIAREREIYRGG